jgi:hypothetical protein
MSNSIFSSRCLSVYRYKCLGLFLLCFCRLHVATIYVSSKHASATRSVHVVRKDTSRMVLIAFYGVLENFLITLVKKVLVTKIFNQFLGAFVKFAKNDY